MGKAALLVVVATTLASVIVYMSQDRQAYEVAMSEALYANGLLAREAAKSGFNRATSRVIRDFEGYRESVQDLANQGATMDLSVTDGPGGTVVVEVTGFYGEAEYTISGTFQRNSERVLDALSIDGPLKKFEIKDDAQISGLDTQVDGEDGGSVDVHAILSTLSASHDVVEEGLEDADSDVVVTGVDGADDAVEGEIGMDWGGLVQAIKEYDGALLTEIVGDAKFDDEGETFGSAANPRVLRVTGKVEMKEDFRGYGILYLEAGDLKMDDTARWDGLIIASSPDSKFELKNNSEIFGAVILTALSEDGAGGDKPGGGGLPGGHFDVDVFDAQNKIYHEHQYDDDFDRTDVDLMENTAGCKSDGALCWDEVLTGVSEGWVGIANYENSSGTYRLKNADMDIQGDLTGDSDDEPDLVLMDLTTMEEFWADFDALCMLIESSPGDVQSDDGNRNGAFTFEIYENESDDKPGDLLYELSVYHHYKDDFPCGGGGGGEGEDDSTVYGKPIEVKIEKYSRIQYSLEALANALELFPDYAISEGGVVLATREDSGTRPSRRLTGSE